MLHGWREFELFWRGDLPLYVATDAANIREEKLLCEGCAAAFQHEDWIELHEPPLLMRGGADEYTVDTAE